MKWISVEDRLPDIRKNVLVYSKNGKVAEGERIRSNNGNENVWCQYRWSTIFSNDEVTHWMSLPKPPKTKPSLEGYKKYTTGWSTDYYVNRKGEFCSCQNGTIRTQKVGSRGLITYYDDDSKYRKRTKASIIVARMFFPEFDEETMLVKHKNGDVTDNRVENIYLVKRSEALIETREKHGKR